MELPVRPRRDVIAVTGSDAAVFLQGQLSQDVATMPSDGDERRWAFLLEPTGKPTAWLAVVRPDDERFELEVDAGWAEAVVTRLHRFLMRVAVEVTAVGERTVGGAGEVERILAMVPAMGAEVTPEVIPAELGQRIIDLSVSFTKGCYTGQELVARVDSRGSNTPRHLRLIHLDGMVDVAAPVVVEGEALGSVTSVAATAGGAVGLAFLGRKASDGEADAQVDGVRARVEALGSVGEGEPD